MDHARDRAASVVACALLVLLPGCFAEDVAPSGVDVATATVRGLVVDALFEPIPGATVTLLLDNRTTTTGPDGRFVLEAVPGPAALVNARADGYEPASARVSLEGGDAFTRIELRKLPSAVPYSVALEHAGFVSCAAFVQLAAERRVVSCGERDPNDQRDLAFDVPVATGIAGVVLELIWEPGSSAASRFHFRASLLVGDEERQLGASEGNGYARILVTRTVAEEILVPGAVLRTRTEPAPSLLDEEAFTDVGLAFAQPFTVIATLFYHAPPDPAYTAVRSSA